MFEILVCVLFVWLFVKAIGLALKVSWGLAKVIAVVLSVLALPALIFCLLLAGGFVLLIPVALVAIAWAILKACLV